MEKNSKIYLPGHNGLAGSAILRKLQKEGYNNILFKSHEELELTRQDEVERFFERERPEYVFLAAAKVGGILANSSYPAEFIHDNLAIQINIIHNSYLYDVKKLLFLGSSCIYPKASPQPIKEKYLLSGYLEPTNEPYAIAKIAGIKMCQSYNRQYRTRFISVMPTNLYGPNDNFDLETSHVLAALIRKIVEAKKWGNNEVEIWGTGSPRREFMYVEDFADACLFIMNLPDEKHALFSGSDSQCQLNVGTGKDLTIRELAEIISGIVGFEGKLRFDTTKPDGTPRKLLDVSKLHELGWHSKIGLKQGIEETYKWYVEEVVNAEK